MDARFAFFEEVCLPPFRIQTDSRFRHVVLDSTIMPQTWRDRLERLREQSRFEIFPVAPETAVEDALRACMATIDVKQGPELTPADRTAGRR